MTYICYTPWSPREETLEIVDRANVIIEAYVAQGFTLTLRQLYYQFVARGLLPNSSKHYNSLQAIINKARLAGLVNWEALEDRERNLKKLAQWDSPQHLLRDAANQFRFDKWSTQDTRVEVWIEKNALIGVIQKVCDDNQVPYFACRGYTSQSEQWRAGQRFIDYINQGQRVLILHFGDHDPSGVDMTRDNHDRLRMFIEYESDRGYFEIRRMALNMDQVHKYNPPPNPAKRTDKRAKKYIDQYGEESWELDALDPPVIAALIQEEIESIRDPERWDDFVMMEAEVTDRLLKLKDDWE